MIFPSNVEVDEWMNELGDLETWFSESKDMIMSRNRGEKLSGPERVLVMECEQFKLNKNATLDMVVSTNSVVVCGCIYLTSHNICFNMT